MNKSIISVAFSKAVISRANYDNVLQWIFYIETLSHNCDVLKSFNYISPSLIINKFLTKTVLYVISLHLRISKDVTKASALNDF